MKNIFLIINYNDYESTKTLIENIKGYTILDAIVVLDNHSNDGSYEQLKWFSSETIHIVRTLKNGGYSHGMNEGCKYIESKFGRSNIFISNSDIVIYQESDLRLLIEEKKDYAVIAPVIKEHDGLNRGWRVPSVGVDILLNIVYLHRLLRPKLTQYKDSHYASTIAEVEVVSGCFFVIDTQSLKAIDYFDENTFLYYEENILSKKLQKIHKKEAILNSVQVFHNHSVTIDKSIKRLQKYDILKESQWYFQTTYNKANLIQRLLLKLTVKFSRIIIKTGSK